LLSISGKSSVISPKRESIEEITGKIPLKGRDGWIE